MIDSSSPPFWLVAAPDGTEAAPAAPAILPPTPELYAKHGGFVWRVLARVGVPPADREDLLQEVFVVVHRTRQSYEGRGQVTSWLYGIALRVASGHRRRLHVRSEVVGGAPSEDSPGVIDSRTPEQGALDRQRAAWLEALLAELPAKKRVVFVMFELEGYSCIEIADELGIAVGTVYSRLHEARAAVAAAYTRLQHAPLEGSDP